MGRLTRDQIRQLNRMERRTMGIRLGDLLDEIAITDTEEIRDLAVTPAKLSADCTELASLAYRQDGNITANITSKMVGIAAGAGRIRAAGFWLGTTGTDTTNPLALEMDVKINGTTIFSTKPKIDKTAANGATTFTAGTGVVVGVVNTAANTVAAADLVTVEFALTRTASPGTEMADVFGQGWIASKVGA